jgi:hypothetical protein
MQYDVAVVTEATNGTLVDFCYSRAQYAAGPTGAHCAAREDSWK